MAKPLVAVETIYDTALKLLDEDGSDALNARNLAAALNCSTKTLYQQVGKRDEMIGQLIAHYLAGLELEFKPADSWQASVMLWCNKLRQALLSHPNLFRMMTVEHRAPVAQYVNKLLQVLVEDGFPDELALRACRVLVNLTISLSLAEIVAPESSRKLARRNTTEIGFEDLVVRRRSGKRAQLQSPPEIFDNSIAWTIAGIAAERG